MSVISSPVKIPLYVFLVPGDEDVFKIGIKVSFDNQTFQMYEFDTGGSGFWAAGNDSWWPNYIQPSDPSPQTINYSSGIQYTGDPVLTDIYFEGGLSISTAASRIVEATKGNDASFNTLWADALKSTDPNVTAPLWGNFFGDFGMSLAPFTNKTTGKEWFFGILPQLLPPPADQADPALLNGFIINIGAYPNIAKGSTPVQPLQTGYIQIGLTQADVASFKTLYPMQADSGANPFPFSKIPAYNEQLVVGTLGLSSSVGSFNSSTIGIVFDTGAPSAEIHTDVYQAASPTISINALDPYLDNDIVYSDEMVQGGKTQSSVKKDTSFTLTSNSSTLLQIDKVNTASGQNLVSATTLNLSSVGSGYVNTGLIPFFNGPMLYYFPFDGKGGYENGQIGFSS